MTANITKHVICILIFGMISFAFGVTLETAAAAPEKPMVLKASIQTPAGLPLTQELYWWLDEVEKRSGGRVKFERYPGESLAKAAEQVDALESGMADVSLFVTTYTPGKIPLNTITNMPFTFGQAWVNATVYLQWVRSIPEVENEFTRLNIKVVSGWGTGPYFILSNKPIRKIEDFKGKKIIATGPAAELIRAVRGAPLGVTITEAYEALQRGTADGMVVGPSAAGSYHMEEICKYLLKVPVSGACGPVAMHMGTWKRLPPDIQKIILDLAPEHAKALHKIYQVDGDSHYLEVFRKAGLEVIEPSAALTEEVRKIAKEVVWVKWANDQEARKLPGKRALDSYIKLLEKTQVLSPFK